MNAHIPRRDNKLLLSKFDKTFIIQGKSKINLDEVIAVLLGIQPKKF